MDNERKQYCESGGKVPGVSSACRDEHARLLQNLCNTEVEKKWGESTEKKIKQSTSFVSTTIQ